MVLVAVEGENVDVVVGRLVRIGGRLFIVLRDGRVIPLEQLKMEQQEQRDSLPEPDYDSFYRWCTRSATERTCREYVRYLRKLPWPLRKEQLYEMELNKWHILALRSYLNFLEEQGYSVDDWRKLRALKLPSTGADRYIPPVDVVRDSLPRLIPRYRIVYYVMLYTALRLEHALRLLAEWRELHSRLEELPGSCVRIALPASWSDDVKRAFYAYMPRWLKEAIDRIVSLGYQVPRRDSVTKYARSKGAPAPKYIRKFALQHIALILGPQAAAHIGGHDPGAQLLQLPSAVRTKVTEKSYINVEELAKNEYYRYAGWVEENVAPRTLISASSG